MPPKGVFASMLLYVIINVFHCNKVLYFHYTAPQPPNKHNTHSPQISPFEGSGRFSLVTIMTAALGYFQFPVLNPKNKTILLINSNAPIARQITFERLRLSDTVVPVALYFFEKPIDFL